MYAGGFKMDVYIAMSVRWGFEDGCVHSYGCTLGVSRWMCTKLWVYPGGFKMDVYIAMSVRWGF